MVTSARRWAQGGFVGKIPGAGGVVVAAVPSRKSALGAEAPAVAFLPLPRAIVTPARMLRVAAAAAVAVFVLAAPRPALGDYYFYGVACDEFLDDNDMLWYYMSKSPEWAHGSADLKDDRYGKILGGDRDSIYEDLEWYATRLSAGDVFVFAYAGHGGWDMADGNSDDGPTPRPTENDPAPADPAPYAGDEFFGLSGGYYMTDDDFYSALASFDPGVEVIIISGACHSGGWVGGAQDLDKSAPALNNALYAMFAVPEPDLGIALKYSWQQYYSILWLQALAATAGGYKTVDQWFSDAVAFGARQYSYVQMPWDSSAQKYYWWPGPGWMPSEYDKTYFTDHWGWQETYLQLTPVSYSTLDAAYDRLVFTPEPPAAVLIVVGLSALAARRRYGGA